MLLTRVLICCNYLQADKLMRSGFHLHLLLRLKRVYMLGITAMFCIKTVQESIWTSQGLIYY